MLQVSLGAACAWLLAVGVAASWLDPARASAIGAGRLQRARRRLRAFSWAAFATAVVAATVALDARGVTPADLASPAFTTTRFGRAVVLAMGLSALVAIVATWHDFVIAPRALRASVLAPRAPSTPALERAARIAAAASIVLGAALAATLLRLATF
jgi:hypothetical protein